MRKLTADCIYPVSSPPLKNGVVVTDDDGKILALEPRERHDPASLEKHRGAIVPGFINAHCHLELSHMKGVAPTGTGLLPFIKTVVGFRDISQHQILDAIERADREMYEAGIVAVGDISNKADTTATKNRSRIRYYTFVEMFDFLQEDRAQSTFDGYYEVFKQQSDSGGNRKSCVPHAPYSVSKKLFQLINAANESSIINHQSSITVSIHNQETPHEDEFFMKKTGAFMDFYRGFNLPTEAFQPSGKPSICYALEHLDPACRTLFVHNTLTTTEDISAANCLLPTAYWTTCPNANLYIENRLPDYRRFLEANAKVCIGTDSLTSNWQLSVLEEIKTIARYQSYVPFEDLLLWATLNGAEALGFERDFGSIESGKTPGLNLLNLDKNGQLTAASKVKKLL